MPISETFVGPNGVPCAPFPNPQNQTAGRTEFPPHRTVLRQTVLHPEMELLSLIRCQFISTKKYTLGFQGKMLSRGIGIMTGVPNGLLCMVLHLSVELCAAHEIFVTGVVILVGLDMREDIGEG
jgi:hypothetical protein